MSFQKLKQLIDKIDFKCLNPLKWNWRDYKSILKNLLIILICFFLFYVSFFLIKNYSVFSNFQEIEYEDWEAPESGDCTVVGLQLHGSLSTYIVPTSIGENGETTHDEVASQDIVQAISAAEKDISVKAIILEVDSTGGSPVAGEEISIALKKAIKPTVVFIRDIGASAAYLAATGADRIFASRYSEVGGIGVTMSYVDNAGQNAKDGLFYNSLSVGKFKDAGSPDKKMTQEERVMFMRDANIIHQYFIKTVAENRSLDIEKVKKMADGSTVLGLAALENGLIDQIGGIYDVMDYLNGKIGDVSICW